MKNLNKLLLTLLISCSVFVNSNAKLSEKDLNELRTGSEEAGNVYWAYANCIEDKNNSSGIYTETTTTLEYETQVAKNKIACLSILESYLKTKGSDLAKLLEQTKEADFEPYSATSSTLMPHILNSINKTAAKNNKLGPDFLEDVGNEYVAPAVRRVLYQANPSMTK